MPSSRKLVLRKESLTELSPGMLQTVVGASLVCIAGQTFDCTRQIDCISDISWDVCPTVPIVECLRTEVRTACTTIG